MSKRLLRKDVPVEKTWDLNALFTSDEHFKESLKALNDDMSTIMALKGTLHESGKQLYKAVVAIEEISVKISALDTYTGLKESVDATDSSTQSLSMEFISAVTEIETNLTFYDNEIMNLSEEFFKRAFDEAPELEEYRGYLEDIYEQKKYKLSDDTEEALAALGEVTGAPYRTYSISKAADMIFEDITDQEGKVLPNSFALFEGKYEYSEDPILRKNAYESFNKTLSQYKNTYAAVYSTQVKKEVAMARLRGYDSVFDMLLERQKVTKDMYHRQINVIYKELAPHMRKFAELLKKELNLDQLHFYDLKAPIDSTYNPPSTYEETKDVVLKALSIMGDGYVQIMNKAFDERWIDYADNIGKSTGAFCASPYAAHPYILVTFQDNMRDAFTLAHELGHAGHFHIANNKQKFFNTSPSMYNVEAPSTMNEMLLGRYLLNNSNDPKMKKWVILQFMGTYYHNFVTHLLEAAYQRKVYEYAENGTPLTAQLLCETKLEVLRGFWGDAVEIDDDAGMTWMRQPHYYMGLYPYTYSAGLTASTAVSEMIFTEGQPAVDRWLKMLETGGKLRPLELLKVAGMDFSSDEPVQKAVAFVGSLIDQLRDLCQ
ncbi:MAG: oligoendopeptidase F [Clostridia bacterium]|nr:oligoendopeptidase F [Clostridia bacterium]